MSYVLCGYRVSYDDQPHECLLYNEGGNFKVKPLRGKKKGCLRDAFPKGVDPPFPFTRVADNAFTGGIQPTDSEDRAFTVDTMPFTVLTEADIDAIFDTAPASLRMGVRDGAAGCAKVTEKEYVKSVGFKQSLLRAVRVGLMEKLGMRSARSYSYLPTRMDALFVAFEPVDYYAGTDKYPHGPDSVVLRHKIIKHVLEDACPYVKVALFDSLGMVMALSLCLPTGVTGRGAEMFRPSPNHPEACFQIAEDLIYDGGDFRILTREEAAAKTVRVEADTAPRVFFNWIPINGDGEGPKTKPDVTKLKDQLALMRSVYLPEQTSDSFQKGAVIYSTHAPEEPFACLDFSNFYARVAVEFGLDDYVSKTLTLMTSHRTRFPAMKAWIVTLLGKSRWLDPFFYNRMKALSVAVVASTIAANSSAVTGSATDGIMVNPESVDGFVYPEGFPMKKEFVPAVGTPMLSNGPTSYVGVCGTSGKIVHRGLVGGTHPAWYAKVVSALAEGCLGLTDPKGAMDAVRTVLREDAGETRQYLLPDTHRMPLAVSDKRPGTEFYINELCVGICQLYAVVDEHVAPAASFGGDPPPLTQNAWVIKQVNVGKYAETIKDKIERTAGLFSGYPDAVKLCEDAAEVTLEHVFKTLPAERAMYPGGADYV